VRTVFNDVSPVDDQNLTSSADGTEPVGNDETGTPLHKVEQRLLNVDFITDVDRRCGLVEHKDAGVGDDGARDSQQLALSLAEVTSPLGEDGVVPLREAPDELVGVGKRRRRPMSSSVASRRP
jgi:hypothetical protein